MGFQLFVPVSNFTFLRTKITFSWSQIHLCFLPFQKWQEKAQEAKKKYEEDMKAYKAKKANEPDDKSEEESKPKKKGAVKEFMDKKKENNKKKTSSPRKSGDSQKFKSAEFVETDDSSSENEGDVSYTTFICNSFASTSPALQTYFRFVGSRIFP